jgi:hypothetical protein
MAATHSTATVKAATSQPASDNQQVHRGWWRRNWKRLIVGGLLVIFLSAVTGYFIKFGPTLFSEPYRLALGIVDHSPKVIAELGEPLKRSSWLDWTPSGVFEQTGGMEKARLTFSVSGPRGSASVSAVAQGRDEQWSWPQFEVILPADGKHLDLKDEANSGTKPDVERFDPTKEKQSGPKIEPARPDQDIKIDLPSDVSTGK